MKLYAKAFYQSKAWRKLSKLYMGMKNYICERCGKPAEICHHKTYIQPSNIHDVNITLNIDNLEALCRDCHNREHLEREAQCIFDDCGQVVAVTGQQERNQTRSEIEGLQRALAEKGIQILETQKDAK